MTWVLIWLIVGYGGTSGSHEFNTKEDCEKAGESIMGLRTSKVTYVCVSKEEKK